MDSARVAFPQAMKYQLMSGPPVDLASLSRRDLEFVVALSRRALEDESFDDLQMALAGPGAYLLRGGRITGEVMASAVYKVAEDIVDRVGIRQGAIAADDDDQVTAADQIVGVTETAELLGISRNAVIKAATAGRIQGRRIGKAWALLRGSVERYQVSEERVSAGRLGGLARPARRGASPRRKDPGQSSPAAVRRERDRAAAARS